MRRPLAILASLALLVGCRAAGDRAAPRVGPISAADWAGVYASPGTGREIELLSIAWMTLPGDATPRPIYRLFARGDAGGGSIDVTGAARIDGESLHLAIASAAIDDDGDSRSIVSVERYHFRRVGGRVVLLRHEALAAFEADDARALGGLLIKVADEGNGLDDDVDRPFAAPIGR